MRALRGYGGRRHREPVAGAPALSVEDLRVAYPRAARPALDGVSLVVPRGGRTALMGPNGSGKSTLLKAVAGLLAPLAGDVRVFGLPVGACHHRVAYVPQRAEVDWRFPVDVAGLVMGGRAPLLGWLRRPGREDRRAVAAALERVGLEDQAARPVALLSGGQQQRALLARALAQDAGLLLLDEPVSAMDAGARRAVDALLGDLAARGRAIVMATHETGRHRAGFDAVLRLEGGRAAGGASWAG